MFSAGDRAAPILRQGLRIAVVEIGSRAVRFLVADVVDDRVYPSGISRKRPISLGKFVGANSEDIASVARQLKQAIAVFRNEARRNGAERFACFGTEALRKLQEKYPDVVSEIDSDLRVLSSAEEAECSFVAGVKDGNVEAPGGLQYVVIDMGSGSIEVIAGRIRQSVPTITDHVSCALGSRRISRQLQDADHDLEAFDSWLEEKLDEVEIPKPGVGAKTILLGSVPTKAVWLQVRPSPFDKYKPQLVGGASIERDAADKLAREILTTWRKDAAMARRFMDSTIKDDSEINLVVSGLRLLNKILIRQQRRNCVVSSRGTLLGFCEKYLSQTML